MSLSLVNRSLTKVHKLSRSNLVGTSALSSWKNKNRNNLQSLNHGLRSFASTPYKPIVNLGIVMVPQQSAYVIERLGKFSRVLSPGLSFLIPFIDRIAYVHSLKEEAVPIPNQTAITADNVTINIDGVLYLRVINPALASYGVADIYYAMTQLAQTTMRSELGKMTLDKTFSDRDSLNQNIVLTINKASEPWGITCLRYEIRDITPPPLVKVAMDQQAEAERKKRATILESEGVQQSKINLAEGTRQATILSAQAEAAAILTKAEATSRAIERLASAISKQGGKDAVSLRIAEQYVNAFANLAKAGNTILLPSNTSEPAAMVAQAMSIFNNLSKVNNASVGDKVKEASSSTPLTLDMVPSVADANEFLESLLRSNGSTSNKSTPSDASPASNPSGPAPPPPQS